MSGSSDRKLRTAKAIQAAAVRLAERDGLSALTTEAIAREAGVSPRTFFNYYPYKEAAIAGPPKDYPRDASEAFVNGSGRLLDDLIILMRAHLSRFEEERDLFAAVMRLARTDPKLQALHQSALMERHSLMEQMLRARLARQDPRLPTILAGAITSAVRQAVIDWTSGQREDLTDSAIENIRLISTAGSLLVR